VDVEKLMAEADKSECKSINFGSFRQVVTAVLSS
jgi:hypothetical protein